MARLGVELGPLGVLLCGDAKKIDAIFYMAKFLNKKKSIGATSHFCCGKYPQSS
jgi:hypothetical protein